MRTRDTVLEYQKVLDDAGTLSKDLDIVDPVSALDIEVEATNGSLGNKSNYLSDVITKIEIVDGSEVLYSCNLAQLQALQFFKTGKAPVMFYSEHASGAQRGNVRLLFGRHLWDTDYAFNGKAFRNPQIKITSNLAAVRAVSATDAFTTGSLLLSIAAKVMEGQTPPGQYLMTKEINSWTSGTSGDKRVELPTDKAWRMLLLRYWLQGQDCDTACSNLKLTADADKYVMLNRTTKQLDAEAYAQFGGIVWQHNIYRCNAATVRTVLTKEPRVLPVTLQISPYRFFGIPYAWNAQYALRVYDNTPTPVTTDEDIWTLQEGHQLHSVIPVVFGKLDDPASWFDPTGYGKIEAVLSEAAATAASVCLEQVRPS